MRANAKYKTLSFSVFIHILLLRSHTPLSLCSPRGRRTRCYKITKSIILFALSEFKKITLEGEEHPRDKSVSASASASEQADPPPLSLSRSPPKHFLITVT